MSTDTRKERCRPVTHDEAHAAAQRLVNSHFHNHDGARITVPRRFDDDDITMMDYIEEQRTCKGGVIHVERVETIPGKFELITFINKLHEWKELGFAAYGLIVCDIVRNVAKAFDVPENKIWYWVEKERAQPTSGITQVKSA